MRSALHALCVAPCQIVYVSPCGEKFSFIGVAAFAEIITFAVNVRQITVDKGLAARRNQKCVGLFCCLSVGLTIFGVSKQ